MFKRYSKLLLISITLVMCELLAATPMVRAANPTIFIEPSTVIGDLTPAPGSVTQWKVNVSDISFPGMVGYQFYIALDPIAFPEYYPIGNSNFTSDANGWTTTISGTPVGTAAYGWDGTDGNPVPGSGPGSYYLRATSTAGATASITFYTEYSFPWPGPTPLDGGALLSFAYKFSGNSIATSGVTIHIQVVKPSASTATLIGPKYYSTTKPWTYNSTLAMTGAFNEAGTYKLRLRTVLKTAAIGTGNYVQVNWDDDGLMLAKVSAKKGPFLESDPLNVGKISIALKYLRFATNSSVFVMESLVGTPGIDINPVQGGGTIAYVNATAGYGAAHLDLWGTKLLKPTFDPPYNPVEINPHDAMNAYFDNKITGDIDGDADVDGVDFGLFAPTYGRTGLPPHFPSDFDGDGDVDGVDFGLFAPNYGRHYP